MLIIQNYGLFVGHDLNLRKFVILTMLTLITIEAYIQTTMNSNLIEHGSSGFTQT